MKAIWSLLICLVSCAVVGCAVEEPATPWSEGPYFKVIVNQDGLDQAEVWVRGEIGDRLAQESYYSKASNQYLPKCAYLVRRDKTRCNLPLRVHDGDGEYRVSLIHLVDKEGKEINFLRL